MENTRDLPQAELEVMGVLWRKGAATVKEVQSALNGKSKRAYTTVATLLNRLREKKYVEAEERNFAYVFHPLVQRDKVVRRKLDDMVDRVFGGNIAPLAAYIAENRKLKPEQIAALEEIVKSESDFAEKASLKLPPPLKLQRTGRPLKATSDKSGREGR